MAKQIVDTPSMVTDEVLALFRTARKSTLLAIAINLADDFLTADSLDGQRTGVLADGEEALNALTNEKAIFRKLAETWETLYRNGHIDQGPPKDMRE